MPDVDRFDVDAIRQLDGRRDVNDQAVTALAESISKIGLRTPITVRLVDGFLDVDGVVVDGQPVLVTGAHRLAAAKSLGWDRIECYVYDGDSDIDAELWEIDENLCRHELTATEQAEHLAKRKELWEAREAARLETGGSSCATSLPDGRGAGPQQRVSAQVEPKLSARGRENEGRPEGFATETAKATGKSKASINRDVKRASEVCQEARDLIRNTKLDTGATLDKLAKIDAVQQVEYVQEHLQALADKERADALRKESEQRKQEAKRLREEARDECLNFLCTMMNGRDWATLIDLVDRSGGSISASQLRSWQSP